MLRPYCRSCVKNPDDAVHVIGHDYELVRARVGEVQGNLFSRLANYGLKLRSLKDAGAAVRARRDEIGARRTIVMSRQADGTAATWLTLVRS